MNDYDQIIHIFTVVLQKQLYHNDFIVAANDSFLNVNNSECFVYRHLSGVCFSLEITKDVRV